MFKRTPWVLVLLGAASCGTGVAFRTPLPAVRYVAFGDSTTAGPSERDYPDLLRVLLGEPEEAFANEGESGETAPEGLGRLRDLIEAQIFPNTEVFLYWQGGADVADLIGLIDPLLLFSPQNENYPFDELLTEELDDIQAALEAGIEAAQEAGWRVYIATYFPMAPEVTECGALPFDIALPWQIARADIYIERLNERIEAAATNRGATLVDIAAHGDALRSDPSRYFNCNHLSASGNDIVARIFYNTVGVPQEGQ